MKTLEQIDWQLLRDQKSTLVTLLWNKDHNHSLWGLVYLIDELQDYAVDVLGVNEKDVFQEGE